MTFTDDDRDAAPETPPTGGRIGAWLDRTRRYGWLRFLIEATLVALLLRIPVVFLGVPVVGEDTRTAHDWLADYTVLQLFVLAIMVGPILETAFAQWLPISLGRRFFQRDSYAVLLSAWIFGWLHYSQGALLVLIMFTTGLVLAWTFLVWLQRGVLQAFFMTSGVHALLNAVALSAALAMPQEEVEPAAASAEQRAPASVVSPLVATGDPSSHAGGCPVGTPWYALRIASMSIFFIDSSAAIARPAPADS